MALKRADQVACARVHADCLVRRARGESTVWQRRGGRKNSQSANVVRGLRADVGGRKSLRSRRRRRRHRPCVRLRGERCQRTDALDRNHLTPAASESLDVRFQMVTRRSSPPVTIVSESRAMTHWTCEWTGRISSTCVLGLPPAPRHSGAQAAPGGPPRDGFRGNWSALQRLARLLAHRRLRSWQEFAREHKLLSHRALGIRACSRRGGRGGRRRAVACCCHGCLPRDGRRKCASRRVRRLRAIVQSANPDSNVRSWPRPGSCCLGPGQGADSSCCL